MRFGVLVGGVAVTVSRQRALSTMLLLDAGRIVGHDRLIGGLYPEPLEVFARGRELLAGELGVDPSPALAAAHLEVPARRGAAPGCSRAAHQLRRTGHGARADFGLALTPGGWYSPDEMRCHIALARGRIAKDAGESGQARHHLDEVPRRAVGQRNRLTETAVRAELAAPAGP